MDEIFDEQRLQTLQKSCQLKWGQGANPFAIDVHRTSRANGGSLETKSWEKRPWLAKDAMVMFVLRWVHGSELILDVVPSLKLI